MSKVLILLFCFLAHQANATDSSDCASQLSSVGWYKGNVFIIYENQLEREAMQEMLAQKEPSVEGFATLDHFLISPRRFDQGIMIVDGRFSDASRDLNKFKSPKILIINAGDVAAAVRVMRAGADEVLEYPFGNSDLEASINRVWAHELVNKSSTFNDGFDQGPLARLTPRERQILQYVADGYPNKLTAHELGISCRTVEVHRASIMQKVQARSTAALVRLVVEAQSVSRGY